MLLGLVDGAQDLGVWIQKMAVQHGPRLTGAWEDLQDAGDDLVRIFDHLVDAGQPIAAVLAQLGGGVALGGIIAASQALAATTGYLAENESAVRLLLAGMVALGANRAAVMLSGQFDRLALSIYDAAGTMAKTKTAGHLRSIGTGARDMGGAVVGAFRNADNYTGQWSRGVGKLNSGVRGLGSSIVGAVGSTAALTLGFYALISAQANAERQAQALVDANRDVRDSYDSAGLQQSIADTRQELENQMEEWHKYDGIGGILRGTVEVLSPLENKVYDNAKAVDALRDSAADLEGQQARLDHVTGALGTTFGLTESQSIRLLRSMKIDLSGPIDLANIIGRVNTELTKLAGTDPKTETVINALNVVGDETETVTEKLDAFKDALDGIFTPDKDYFAATTAYAAGFRGLATAITESGGSFDAWTDEGSAARAELEGFFDTALDRSSALVTKLTGEGVAFDEAVRQAAHGVDAAREAIIGMGEAAGVGRDEMSALLDEIGLTPENIEMILTLQGGEETQAQIDELNRQAILLGRERQINIGMEDGEAVAAMGNVRDLLANYVASDPSVALRLNAADPIGKTQLIEAELQELADRNPVVKAWLDDTDVQERTTAINEWATWYTGADFLAEALLETHGAELGFTDLDQWASFYESLDPTTQAHLASGQALQSFAGLGQESKFYEMLDPTTRAILDSLPADDGFARLMAAAEAFRVSNPTATALAVTSAAEIALEHTARRRTAHIDVDVNVGSAAALLVAASQRRWGGIDHYASGGVREAMLGSGRNMVWWDEPETGGEGYVPRLGDPRRSVPIIRTIADWYGLAVVPKEMGAKSFTAMAAGGIMRAPQGPIYAPNPTWRQQAASSVLGDITINARVYVGDREITDIARVEADLVVAGDRREQRRVNWSMGGGLR